MTTKDKTPPPKPQKAWGIKKSRMGWHAIEYILADGKVVLEKASPPELRSLAIERFLRLTSMGAVEE